jgi:hypothetical protein
VGLGVAIVAQYGEGDIVEGTVTRVGPSAPSLMWPHPCPASSPDR